MSAPARIARTANAFTVHFRPGCQIVQRAYPVPYRELGDVRSEELALHSENGALHSRSRQRAVVPVLVVKLHALALAHRIPRQAYESAPGQVDEAALPRGMGLCAAFVSERI